MTIQKTANGVSGTPLLDDAPLAERIFRHIDDGTTDLGEQVWREPVSHYLSVERFNAECKLIRQHPTPFCPWMKCQEWAGSRDRLLLDSVP